MVKKERVLEKIEKKKVQKQQYEQEKESYIKKLKDLEENIDDLDLEIFLLEDHVKKMEG